MKGTVIVTAGKLLGAGDDKTADYFAGLEPGQEYEIAIKKKNGKRTLTQNGSLHRYFNILSVELNKNGLDAGTVIKVPIEFDEKITKKYMFHPIMRALYPDIKSSKDLNTKQISIVYEHLNRLTAEKFGVSVQWPSRFNFNSFDY